MRCLLEHKPCLLAQLMGLSFTGQRGSGEDLSRPRINLLVRPLPGSYATSVPRSAHKYMVSTNGSSPDKVLE